ncbi:MAG: IS66 family insertion sequence element accessory protein TnpB [Bdellovibrionales bacterium]|nr:IS66 family insertion sequence element accessory protein TnpB [Bdellovibrionales bacterium]
MWSLQGADGEGPHEWSSLFFSNRSRKSLKILVYDSQGFWIFHKRLSRGSFKWWRTGEESRVSYEPQSWQFLSGMEIPI